jgi:hypothetical protein
MDLLEFQAMVAVMVVQTQVVVVAVQCTNNFIQVQVVAEL